VVGEGCATSARRQEPRIRCEFGALNCQSPRASRTRGPVGCQVLLCRVWARLAAPAGATQPRRSKCPVARERYRQHASRLGHVGNGESALLDHAMIVQSDRRETKESMLIPLGRCTDSRNSAGRREAKIPQVDVPVVGRGGRTVWSLE